MHTIRALFLALTLSPGLALAQDFRIEPVATGLEEPWALAFLPDGAFLVTEREGRLLLFAGPGAAPRPVAGGPDVAATGQGGLLDVMVPRDFVQSRRIWLSYAGPAGLMGAATALGHGRFSDDGTRLDDFREVFKGPGTRGGRHFGSRIVEGRDGTIYLTTGDRGQDMLAQDRSRPEGKVLAFDPEGRAATAAGFAGQDVLPGLYSYGHRNIQGATLDLEGRLWTVEHGARGGDELNRPEGGRNYGWPIISYGVEYSGGRIGEGTEKPGLEQPVRYWDPSIAPSGLAILQGRMFPEWRGHVMTGSLNSDYLGRLDPAAGYAETRIETEETARVRDVREAPDGSIWFLSVGNGAAYRIVAD